MTTTATVKTNSRNDLNIIFECSGHLFTTSLITDFIYENELNKKPFGSFELRDDGSISDLGLKSGSFGFLYFTNTTDDGVEEKTMTLPIYLDDVENADRINNFFIYKIKWTAGNVKQMVVREGDIVKQSNSTDALKKIFEVRDCLVEPFSGISKPTDNMNWILVNQDMWQQLETISNKSFLENDYIFWVWDDVNNIFTISSILTEHKKKDSYLLMRDTNSINSTVDSIQIIGNNELAVWRYNIFKKTNVLGSLYKKLFPNISFMGIPSNDIKHGAIRKQNFISLLKSLKDTKMKDVLSETKLDENTVFGDLIIKKQHLNGHDLYAFSDVYREYKFSTYAKIFMTQIYNTVGPPLGTYVSVYNTNNPNNATTVIEVDKTFSDRYIIIKKIVEYKGKTLSRNGKELNITTNFTTTLFLASDNYSSGFDNVSSLVNKVNKFNGT